MPIVYGSAEKAFINDLARESNIGILDSRNNDGNGLISNGRAERQRDTSTIDASLSCANSTPAWKSPTCAGEADPRGMAITAEASRMKLKIQPKLPVFLHADAYFDLNVSARRNRNIRCLSGLPIWSTGQPHVHLAPDNTGNRLMRGFMK